MHNIWRTQWLIYTDPETRKYYEELARNIQVSLNLDQDLLKPYIKTGALPIRMDDDGNPFVLNADVPTVTQRIRFQEPSFVLGVTATVNGVIWRSGAIGGFSGASPIEPNDITNLPEQGNRALDAVYWQWRLPGGTEMVQEDLVPISAFAGTGQAPYLFPLIPVATRGEEYMIEFSIWPPDQARNQDEPPLVDKVAFISYQIHTLILKVGGRVG